MSAREGQPPAVDELAQRVRDGLNWDAQVEYPDVPDALTALDSLLALVARLTEAEASLRSFAIAQSEAIVATTAERDAAERDAATLREALSVMELYLDSCDENDEAPLTSTLRAMLGALAAAAPADKPDRFECGCAAVPTSWRRDGLTGRPVCKEHGRPLAPADVPAGDA